jgi:hypothetical protein
VSGKRFFKRAWQIRCFPLPEDGSRFGSLKVVRHWNLADGESPKKEDYFSKVLRMCFTGTSWHKISLALPPPGALRTPTKRFYKGRTASKRNKGALLPTPSGRVRCVLDHNENHYCCALRVAVLMKHCDIRFGHTEWSGSCHQPIKYNKILALHFVTLDGTKYSQCPGKDLFVTDLGGVTLQRRLRP